MDAFQSGFIYYETPSQQYAPKPSMDDIQLNEWLVGFQQAHADYPDNPYVTPEPVADVLKQLLPSDNEALTTLLAMCRRH